MLIGDFRNLFKYRSLLLLCKKQLFLGRVQILFKRVLFLFTEESFYFFRCRLRLAA